MHKLNVGYLTDVLVPGHNKMTVWSDGIFLVGRKQELAPLGSEKRDSEL